MSNPKEDSTITIDDIKEELTNIQHFLSCDNKGFPVKIFAPPLREVVEDLAKALSYPSDFTGASILFATSVAMGACFKLEVKRGWIEPGILYLSILGDPGTSKSHPVRWILRPLFKRDGQAFKQYEVKKKYYDEAIKMTKSEREESGVGEPEEPIFTKLLLTDYTPESLAFSHKNNPRGLGIYYDEILGWVSSWGRYSGRSQAEMWLSAFNGGGINVDRRGSQPIYLETSHIPVCGTIQPSRLRELIKDGRGSNGFLDRILFAYNENIGCPDFSDTELSDSTYLVWESVVQNLLQFQLDIDQEGNWSCKTLNYLQSLLRYIRIGIRAIEI